MTVGSGINRKAVATRVAQRLAGPAEAILGYQEMIVEDLARAGPEAARADAGRVLDAARALSQLVGDIVASGAGDVDEATLRHDLRTPVNAILGYSEMILEDFEPELARGVASDIRAVIAECGRFLSQVDALMDFSHGAGEGESELDAGIAAGLERALEAPALGAEVAAGRILVIDDTKANRDLLRRQLERQGHSVSTAASAAEGLALLETAGFDVILVDILMPDMSGIELLARLKAEPRWRAMPVIMISGLKEKKAVVRCISAGAEDYLEKPVDPVLLHSRVNASLERVRWQRREKEFLARIEYERDRADALLHAMLPAPVIRRLQEGETLIADRIDAATIIFADIVDFTPLVARTDPPLLLKQLAGIFSAFDDLAAKHGVEKIKTIGDAYMAVAGVPDASPDHPQRALSFARDLIGTMQGEVGQGLAIRVGLHSGPVIAGLVGRLRFVYDVWGEAVNLASRLEASGQPGRIHISEASHAALDQLVRAPEAQMPELKGLGRVRTFLVD